MPPKVILVLGGTCFQGRLLIKRLVHDSAGYTVVVANRGRTYWDEALPSAWQGGPGRVVQALGDRDKEGFERHIRAAVERETGGDLSRMTAAVDFSCFHPRQIHAMLPFLLDVSASHVGDPHGFVYMFISSDSVYDSCVHASHHTSSDRKTTSHDAAGHITEALTQLGRPDKASTRLRLHRRNRYGGNKLRIEDILRQTPHHFTWLALRLADVIGPFDDTGRFWAMYLLARFCPEHLYVSPDVGRTVASFTLSEDVVGVICQRVESAAAAAQQPGVGGALHPDVKRQRTYPSNPQVGWDSDSSSSSSGSSSSSSSGSDSSSSLLRRAPHVVEEVPADGAGWRRRAVNICCVEGVSIGGFIEAAAREAVQALPSAGRPPRVVEAAPREKFKGVLSKYGTADFFPSVDCGAMSPELAVRLLGFRPTPLQEALGKTCAFFEAATQRVAEGGYAGEWARVMKKLPSHARSAVQAAVGGGGRT